MTQPNLKIMHQPISALKTRANNPRTHSKKQIRQIADSIQEFGFVSPILVDPKNIVIAGHGRLQAAKLFELERVPTVCLGHLSEAQIRAYVIADNKLAALAGWDKELLALEITELIELEEDLDLTVTGFEIEDLHLMSDTAGSAQTSLDQPLPDIDRKNPPICRLGDLWQCGDHLLYCGDALAPLSYEKLLGESRADMVITDPPYNVPIKGHVSGLGTNKHDEFVMASSEMSRPEFLRFLSCICRQLTRFSKSGSLHYVFMDWRSIADLIAAGEEHFSELMNIIVWAKSNGGMGALYRSQHELVALFKNGKRSHKNNIALGANGRYRTNVWNYPGMTSFGNDRGQELALHPTVKNLDMITDAIRDVTDKRDIVLDPFGGSGTTLIAAEQSGRRARLVELDSHYCDCILHRAKSAGLSSILLPNETEFEVVQRERTSRSSQPDPEVMQTDHDNCGSYIDLGG